MRAKPALLYEARLVAGWASLLPALGLPAYAVLARLLWAGNDELALGTLLNTFVVLLPLEAGLSAAHLMGIESEASFDELRHSYPEPRLKLPLLRTGAALTFLLLAVGLGLAGFGWVWGAFDIGLLPAMLPALPPALFLCGLSLLVGGLSRSYWAAAGAAMGWWFLELQTRGQVSGALFLFHPVWPRAGLLPELNQALLAGVGVVFLLTNAWVYARRGGWRLRRPALGAG